MAAGARKRAAAAKQRSGSGAAAEQDTQVDAPSTSSTTVTPVRRKSVARRTLKAIAGVACIACLVLAVLPYFQDGRRSHSGAHTSMPVREGEKRAPIDKSKAQPPALNQTQRQAAAQAAQAAQLARANLYLKTNLPFTIPQRTLTDNVVRRADVERRDAVKEAFDASWSAYVDDAFGADEYHPIERKGSNFSVDGGVGYFIIDVIDLLLIMNDEQEYKRARDWIERLSWDDKRGKFSVFETTIRTLGGLLSAHALCSPQYNALSRRTSAMCAPGDSEMFLTKAVGLAESLAPAFQANRLGLPEREIDFSTQEVFADVDNSGMISLAEAATIQLEFKFLAHVTQDERWWRIAERPIEVVRKASQRSRSDGLLPIFLSPQTGSPIPSEIRLGSRGDSYYEYLIKQFVQTNRTETVYLDMYQRAMAGIKMHLLQLSPKRKMLHTNEIMPRLDPRTGRQTLMLMAKQDHLVCFLGGTAMLGALHVQQSAPLQPAYSLAYPLDALPTSELAQEDWNVGHGLIKMCVETYTDTKTGLSPEIAMFRMVNDTYGGTESDWYIKQPRAPVVRKKGAKTAPAPKPLIDARNILRPETVESLFVAFHLTGDEQYRTWGWQIFQAFVKATRLPAKDGKPGAFTSIRDVDVEPHLVEREDRMETFWLAETLKYLYLLFDDQDTLRLDDWVLNTEAHPLPIFTPNFDTSVL